MLSPGAGAFPPGGVGDPLGGILRGILFIVPRGCVSGGASPLRVNQQTIVSLLRGLFTSILCRAGSSPSSASRGPRGGDGEVVRKEEGWARGRTAPTRGRGCKRVCPFALGGARCRCLPSGQCLARCWFPARRPQSSRRGVAQPGEPRFQCSRSRNASGRDGRGKARLAPHVHFNRAEAHSPKRPSCSIHCIVLSHCSRRQHTPHV